MTRPVRVKMALKERPTEVKVGYLTYAVKYLPHETWDATDGEKMGVCHNLRSEIYIRLGDEGSKEYSEQVLQEVLMHEILHAIWHTTNLAQNPEGPGKNEMEEYIVGIVSGPLLAVLRDNPEVRKYLLNG